MPVVDLSMMGLDGQQAYHTRMATAAQAKHANAEADKTVIENETAERMNELSQLATAKLKARAARKDPGNELDAGGVAERMQSLAEPMEFVAGVYLEGGAIEQATDLLKDASTIRKQEADIKDGEVTRQKQRLEAIQIGAKIAASKLGMAQNQDEWDQGMKELEDAGVVEPDLMEKLKAQPFSPDVAEYFRNQGMSVGEQARLEQQQLNLEATEAYRDSQIAHQDRMATLAERRAEEAERARRVAEKAGGTKQTSAGAPSKEVRTSVKRALSATVYKGAEEDGDIESAVDYVASTAQDLVRTDKTLSWDTAVNRAILMGQNANIFVVEGDTPNWIERKFGAKGPSAKFNAPLMPTNKAELKKGQAYRTPKGLATWNGTAFESAE